MIMMVTETMLTRVTLIRWGRSSLSPSMSAPALVALEHRLKEELRFIILAMAIVINIIIILTGPMLRREIQICILTILSIGPNYILPLQVLLRGGGRQCETVAGLDHQDTMEYVSGQQVGIRGGCICKFFFGWVGGEIMIDLGIRWCLTGNLTKV